MAGRNIRSGLSHNIREYVSDQRDIFDRFVTEEWESYLDPKWQRLRKAQVYDILGSAPKTYSVLDLGCGAGYPDIIFAMSGKVGKVVGVDYSPKSVARANECYPHPKIERIVADFMADRQTLERLGTFDLVVSFSVIEHLTDPGGFLEVCRSCVEPGGHIGVVTPNRLRFENRIYKALALPLKKVDCLHYREFSIAELVSMGKGMGLAYAGCFGHGIGRWAPSLSHGIGVIFRKADR